MSEKGITLHYIRGMHFIDKLFKEVVKDKYDKKRDVDFFVDYAYKCRDNPLFLFDLNNFIITCAIATMGLNKENIERSDNSKNYGYDLKYSEKNLYIKAKYEAFKRTNTIETPFKDWLSVASVSENIASDNNYLFNVRNALMHSEYDLNLGEDNYNYLTIDLHNSNYTGFEGKVYIPCFLEFMKHYYSNDGFFGIVNNIYTFRGENKKIKNEESLDKYLRGLEFFKLIYENGNEYSKTVEFKMAHQNKKVEKLKNVGKEKVDLSEENIESIKLLIEKYFGDAFYTYSMDMQSRLILQLLKYTKDSKTVFSEWAMHFYFSAVSSIYGVKVGDDFISVFATEPSLLMVKSYLILYRLQNKNFEDIDYNLIEDIDYSFDTSEPYYADFKNKLINKGINVSEDEYKKRYFCEIYRNSLAHGNVKMKVRKDSDGEIRQYFVFEDIYGSRNRTIIISQEELKRFTCFEAFSRKYAKIKTVPSPTPSRR